MATGDTEVLQVILMLLACLAGEVCKQIPVRPLRGPCKSSASFYDKCRGKKNKRTCLNCGSDFGLKSEVFSIVF